MEKCFESTNRINLVIANKHPMQQWLSIDEAREHVEPRRLGVRFREQRRTASPTLSWPRCGIDPRDGAARRQRSCCARSVPDLKVRFVCVTDLFALALPDAHPDGMSQEDFTELFTKDRPVIFNFHGYPSAVHQLIHRRPQPGALPCARLRGGGHDDDPLQPARDERRRPLPARHRGAEPRGHRRRRDGEGHVRRVRGPLDLERART